MEKKASTVTYVIQLVIILIFFAILCFPLTLMALDGPDETEVESEEYCCRGCGRRPESAERDG